MPNLILAALTPAQRERLRPHLTMRTVRPRQVLYRAGEPLTTVYFPEGGVFSVTAELGDGGTVEALTVGDEGMVGIEAVFTPAPVATGTALMQVPGAGAVSLSVPVLRRELLAGGALQEVVGRYAQAVLAQTMQSLACNTLHLVEQRCCRWLLMTQDRVHGDEFTLSQEFLAIMLGIRRQSVTVVAGELQRAGLIRYKHGRVTVVNRAGLEAGSCECYAAVRRQLDQVFS